MTALYLLRCDLCHLCTWPRWVPGTYRDAIDHYRTTHQGKDQ